MMNNKANVYIYTRVSTAMQVEGFSLEGQKERIKRYADAFEYKIVEEYEDAGKSGKSVEGRYAFKRMLEDIANNKHNAKYVLVYKLSRFGRNASDVLNSLQFMQDFGVNLICVEDGIDSSKDAGKLMISVLSAVSEIERENILVQTMEGRKQKAREGKWNGGFAPYGYKLVNGFLEVEEEEAKAIKVIFDKYVNTDMGSNGIAKYLYNHGIEKKARQNGKNTMFSAHLVRIVLENPVYCGKIAYGRRKNEKVNGSRNEYKVVKQNSYMICDGVHEAIVDSELWEKAQVKRKVQAKKYERTEKNNEKVHLLSGILKCPICDAGMYGNKSIKKRKDNSGENYKDYWYYGCKHRGMVNGHKCEFKKQLNEAKLDNSITEIISKMVSNPKFADIIQKKINIKVDTSEIDDEIKIYHQKLLKVENAKKTIEKQMDLLDVDEKQYERKFYDLKERMDETYNKIDELEELIEINKEKKRGIEVEKMTGENIYKILIYFDKLYDKMSEIDKRELIRSIVSEIQVYEKEQLNGQWLKSIKFKFPLIHEDLEVSEISLDNNSHVEAVCLLSKV